MNIKPDKIKPTISRVFESDIARIADAFKKKVAGGFIVITADMTDTELEQKIKSPRVGGQNLNSKEIAEVLQILRGTIDTLKPKPKEETKIILEPEFIPTIVPKIETNLKVVNDEALETNLSNYEEVKKTKEEKDALLDDNTDIDTIYNQVMQLEKAKILETDDYYYEFTKLGYTKDEIEKNIIEIKTREKQFAEKGSVDKKKSKKIAAMTEIALEYGVSELKWYGENIEIEQTSRFDDIKRGVDGVLKIRKEKTESDFIGLGIDATFRGLYSEQYKEKIFALLRSIANGYKTKIKYFKERNGELKKEFAVPKIVLSFDTTDVKNLVYMLSHVDDSKIQNIYKDHNIKFEMMNQIMVQCEKLAGFAKKHSNSIGEGYANTLQSIEDLKNNNDTISRSVMSRHGSKISQHFDVLISEFEEIWQKELIEKQSQNVYVIEKLENKEEKIDENNEDYNIESIAA